MRNSTSRLESLPCASFDCRNHVVGEDQAVKELQITELGTFIGRNDWKQGGPR